MQRRLTDLVGKAVTDADPITAGGSIGVIVVAADADRVIVFPVAVDHDTTVARHASDQAGPIDLVAALQVGRPFEDEDDGVVLADLKGVMKRRELRRTVYHHLVTQLLRRLM